MKLFAEFEAVKFPEENLIFVTHNEFLYYIYNPKYEVWRKHRNAGNDCITVSNYQDINRAELEAAMNGVFPEKETDFMRLCHPRQLCIRDMLYLFKEDYANYMSDYAIYHTVHEFLLESSICYKAFEEIKKLFEKAVVRQQTNQQILRNIKKLCSQMIGRDIFKKEIGIVDGHDSSSYFWIMPVRVIDYKDSASLDSVAKMRSAEISIEENDVDRYLTPFLYKYFDEELKANKKRRYVTGFEWYLEHNFFTYDSIRNILGDITDTIEVFSSGRETEYTKKLKETNTEIELIIDFYHRFIYRMEYMMCVGKEKGFDLISFMGP
jgi:hypothetical protein